AVLPRRWGGGPSRVRRADRGAGARLAGRRLRPAHPDDRAHRQRQDAGRLPLVPRPRRLRAVAPGGRAVPRPVRLTAQGPGGGRRAQPARAAGRPPAPGRAAAPAVPDIAVAIRSGDTPVEERRGMERRPPDVLITTP